MANSLFSTFVSPISRGRDTWFFAGLASSYPDIVHSGNARLANRLPCKEALAPGCKVFHVSRGGGSDAVEISVDEVEEVQAGNLQDQVLVFRYKGKFHAVNNKCPHAAYALSNGTPFDIEDFGVTLSAGITCSKHGWAFDLFTGIGDRGNYRLTVWEVELRPARHDMSTGDTSYEPDDEVWFRKKQRIG